MCHPVRNVIVGFPLTVFFPLPTRVLSPLATRSSFIDPSSFRRYPLLTLLNVLFSSSSLGTMCVLPLLMCMSLVVTQIEMRFSIISDTIDP